MKSNLCRVAVAVISLAFLAVAAEEKPDPRQLVLSANEISDISKAGPHQLTGVVILNPGSSNEGRGTITVYRDQDQYRSDVELSGRRHTWMRLANKLFVSDSSPFAFFGLARLDNLENAWRENPGKEAETKFSNLKRKSLEGTDYWCFEAKHGDSIAARLCLDASRKFVVSAGYGDDTYEFLEYAKVADRQYPTHIRKIKNGKTVLEVRGLRAELGPVPPTAFLAPQDAREYETCDEMKSPTLISSPDFLPPNTPTIAGEWVKIFVFGIVQEDGTVKQVKAVTIPPRPALVNAVVESILRRRYKPAMCGAKPVAGEMHLEIEVQSPMIR